MNAGMGGTVNLPFRDGDMLKLGLLFAAPSRGGEVLVNEVDATRDPATRKKDKRLSMLQCRSYRALLSV